jgi:uncharacterized membrane protein YeaQ/YmgE (transglycosylase-associated protein family)
MLHLAREIPTPEQANPPLMRQGREDILKAIWFEHRSNCQRTGNLEVKMTLVSILLLLLIAAVAGSIGQALAGYSMGGCLLSIVVGFIGAVLGLWLARELGLPEPLPITVGGETFPLLWSIVGSALFAAVIGLLTRRRIWG